MFMMVEIVGGLLANSLAIITDAAHMLSDVGGFIVSLLALQLSRLEATQEYTYGFKQVEPPLGNCDRMACSKGLNKSPQSLIHRSELLHFPVGVSI
eukprot:Skav223812  [mRNA]  locus=scaffold575:783306:783658:- [translate_table: standard]